MQPSQSTATHNGLLAVGIILDSTDFEDVFFKSSVKSSSSRNVGMTQIIDV